jgi:GNAT superfamily N-acetyltransferase
VNQTTGESGESPLVLERFDPNRHEVAAFTCGNAALDGYIHTTIRRDEEEHTAAGYVLIDPSRDSQHVVGYITLSSYAFSRRQARRRDRDKYLGGYDSVPAALIGRLAVATTEQGQGVGSVLLYSALVQVLRIREHLGISVVVVHGIDDSAANFYEHNGFTRFRDEPHHLYYPLATFEASLLDSERVAIRQSS